MIHSLAEAYREEKRHNNRFLMGVSASAIAFAFHETANRDFSYSLIAIGIAAVFWGVSFGAGIITSNKKATGYLLESIEIPEKAGYQFARTAVDDATKDLNKETANSEKVQQWMMLAGAALFAIGHVLFLAESNFSETANEAPPTEIQKPVGGNELQPMPRLSPPSPPSPLHSLPQSSAHLPRGR